MKFVDFLNESVKASTNYTSWHATCVKNGIEEGELAVINGGVNPFHLYKGYKSLYKKTKSDEDFFDFVKSASKNIRFEETNGYEDFVNTLEDIIKDVDSKMSASELKSKWEKTIIPAYENKIEAYFAVLDGSLTTSTGGTSWRWNIYDIEDTHGYVDKYGCVVYGHHLELDKSYKFIHNDRFTMFGSPYTPKYEFNNPAELKRILKSLGYATFSKAYSKPDGQTSTKIYSLKTALSASQYAKMAKN